jgi:hypothetical protein
MWGRWFVESTMKYTVSALHGPTGKRREWRTDDAYAARLLRQMLERPIDHDPSDFVDVRVEKEKVEA